MTDTKHAGTPRCPKCGSASIENSADGKISICSECQTFFAALAEENALLRKALQMLYERWENGTPSYEDPEDKTGYLGLACKVTAMEEQEIIAALEVKP